MSPATLFLPRNKVQILYTINVHVFLLVPGSCPSPRSRDHEHLSCSCSQVSSDPRSSHLLSSSRRQSTSSWNLLLRSSRPTRSHTRPLRLGDRSGPADGPFPWESLRGGSSSAEVAFTGGSGCSVRVTTGRASSEQPAAGEHVALGSHRAAPPSLCWGLTLQTTSHLLQEEL